MPVLTAITVLILMQLLGETLVAWLHLPFPGALAGLLLLLAWFVWRGQVPRGLRDTAGHALPHLMLLFIAPVTALLLHLDRIAAEWLAFLAACLGSAALATLVTAFTFRWMLARQARKGKSIS
ncbi:CidA/LrgA family protein [Pusillimonas sp. CC-YST705]|uniref:CidA/LrgA family protein n=1 Tax=Mesopusillimonas faecipullorum TaxID=2755040 RepID=A0ABS8CAY9_9BURK|nr:CidA/LrgA family protein [Mesopusillimonas faecipullorum]MCB5363202.1 CidA/LrgA family protein [Mesopusillimonas faecipullorum]